MRLSVITPIYNSAHLLFKLINALESDSDLIYEWIVVDSGSTDSSIATIMASCYNLRYKTKVIQQPKEGPYKAMNAGIEHASGEYIAIFNSDDYPLSGSLRQLHTDISRSFPDVYYGRVVSCNQIIGSRNFFHWSNFRMNNIHPATVVKKSVYHSIGLYDSSICIAADLDWYLRCKRVSSHLSIQYNQNYLVYYTPGGISSQSPQSFAGMLLILRKNLFSAPLSTLYSFLLYLWSLLLRSGFFKISYVPSPSHIYRHSTHIPSLSIVMATYNGAEYIHEQLSSILDQMSPNDELLIRDDFSNDATIFHITEAIQKTDMSVTLTVNSMNLGPSKTFELLINEAKNDIIVFSDQDDIWLGDRLGRIRYFSRSYTASVFNSIYVSVADVGSTFAICRPTRNIIRNIIKPSFIGCHIAIDRRYLQQFLPFPRSVYMYDMYLGIILSITKSVKFDSEPSMLYRRHDNVFTPSHSSLLNKVIWRFRYIVTIIFVLTRRWKGSFG